MAVVICLKKMMRSHSFKHFLSPFVILLFQYPTTQFAGEKDNHAPAEGADRCVVIVSLLKCRIMFLLFNRHKPCSIKRI